MGVKIFRDDNWHRITNGVISRKDIMHLDGEKDRELIGYLIAHAPKPCRDSMMEYAAEKYSMDGEAEPRINIDDPEDTFFWEYAVLREQVMREENREANGEEANMDRKDPVLKIISGKVARMSAPGLRAWWKKWKQRVRRCLRRIRCLLIIWRRGIQ